MSAWLALIRTARYLSDVQAVYDHIEQDNPNAAMRKLLLTDDQVDASGDPNFPCRRGRKAGTMELVAHPNHVVVLKQTKTVVTSLNIVHVARQYPKNAIKKIAAYALFGRARSLKYDQKDS